MKRRVLVIGLVVASLVALGTTVVYAQSNGVERLAPDHIRLHGGNVRMGYAAPAGQPTADTSAPEVTVIRIANNHIRFSMKRSHKSGASGDMPLSGGGPFDGWTCDVWQYASKLDATHMIGHSEINCSEEMLTLKGDEYADKCTGLQGNTCTLWQMFNVFPHCEVTAAWNMSCPTNGGQYTQTTWANSLWRMRTVACATPFAGRGVTACGPVAFEVWF